MASRITRGALALAAAAGALLRIGRPDTRASDPDGGFLNQPLGEVTKNHFFGWFHLVEVAREGLPGGGEKIDFRPSGDRFHPLAMVTAEVDADRRIRRIELVLKRSFIASPRDGSFASDIAKSFISGAPPLGDSAQLSTLADEIQYRTKSSPPLIVGSGYNPPELPDPPSKAYQTYAGARRSEQRELAHCLFGIENEQASNEDQLRIQFSIR